MGLLVAALCALYVSECFVRWRPGDWVFRRGTFGAMRGVNAPDVTLFAGRYAFVWTSWWPGHLAHVVSGAAVDGRDTRARVERLRRETRWVRAGAGSLLALVLVVFPALVLTERVLPWLLVLASGFVVTWAWTFGAFWVAHRRVHRRGPSLEAWLVLASSPISLIRAPAVVGLTALHDAHPIAAADALCEDDEFLRIARLWRFDSPDLAAPIERLTDARGLTPALTAPPADPEAGVSLFCPRCHATFMGAAVQCADCDDVALRPLRGRGLTPV
jgi:hypothetical protein